MQNEIWSLISYFGAPSWFITFSPADNKHSICLYYANTKNECIHNCILVNNATILLEITL
jgi:hypothetical protein